MIGLFFLRRTLAAGGILAFAWWSMGAAPSSKVAAPLGHANGAPQFTVKPLHKGGLVPQNLQKEQKVPVGCDRAFSTVAAPAAKSIYGRCVA